MRSPPFNRERHAHGVVDRSLVSRSPRSERSRRTARPAARSAVAPRAAPLRRAGDRLVIWRHTKFDSKDPVSMNPVKACIIVL